MRKIVLMCLAFAIAGGCSISGTSYGHEGEIALPVIEPPPMNSCEKTETEEIKNSASVNGYDNVQIFDKNGDRKVKILLKQPNVPLGSQQ